MIAAKAKNELPACPVETTLTLIGDKWKVLILRDLMPGTKRFGELKKSVGNVSQKVLTAQLRAMEENRCLEIVYRHTYDEKRENRYEVEPYGLKAFRRRWYLIANSVEMGGIYAFALDRVRSMVPTAKAAEIPSDFDCAGFYADAFGIIRERDRKAERVEIRVLGKQANYVRALPLHPTQRETERTAEYSVFEYRLAPTYDFRMELLSNGADVEVLRPAWFREEVKNVVTKMMDRYE